MKYKHKAVWLTLFYSYLIASYSSRIPAYFIDWRKGLPPNNYPGDCVLEVLSFLSAPIITPPVLYFETRLAFIWGFVIVERLLPLFTFINCMILSYIVLRAKLKVQPAAASRKNDSAVSGDFEKTIVSNDNPKVRRSPPDLKD